MSGGHYHHNDSGLTQNQGNQLGDRPCVRQSRTYREHNGGNTMKDIMGQTSLKWDTEQQEGAYAGGRVHGEQTDIGRQQQRAQQQQQQQQQQPQQQGYPPQQAAPQASYAPAPATQSSAAQGRPGHRPGAGAANRTTYNFMTGE